MIRRITRFTVLILLTSLVIGAPAFADDDISKLPRVKQTLVAPPFVPEHDQVAKGGPKVIEVRLEIEEKKMVIDDKGTEFWAFTFGGSVPGPMIIAHENDYVEVTLVNLKKNIMPHNIDFHSATGALGGAELTHVAPGEQVTIRWKATKVGAFVYHCAPGGVMTPWHVVHGMSGAVVVLPRDGLKDGNGKSIKYSKAFYIGEQAFYVPKDANGKYKKYNTAIEGMEEELKVMESLTPSHIVFNGKAGAITGPNSLTSKVGESVLIVHAQANSDTRPHLIGGHGDYVWETGSFNDKPDTDIETWFIRGGSAGAAIYTFKQPGLYVYLNHNLIQAVLKGAAAHIKVEGEWDNDLMKQVSKPSAIK